MKKIIFFCNFFFLYLQPKFESMTSNELKERVFRAKKRIRACGIKQVYPLFSALYPNTDQHKFTVVFAGQMVDEQMTEQLEQIASTVESRQKKTHG